MPSSAHPCGALPVLEQFAGYLRTAHSTPQESAALLAQLTGLLVPVDLVGTVRWDQGALRTECALWPADGADSLTFTEEERSALAHAAADGEKLRAAFLATESGRLLNQPPRPFVILPVREGEAAVGFAFFARRPGGADFSLPQRQALEQIGSMIGLFFGVRTLAAQRDLYHFVFNSVMDQMHTNIYITDPGTDEILFMNRHMQRDFGVKRDPAGLTCWQVLQKDQQGRCAFCPIPRLTDQGEGGAPFIWEEANPVTGRTYQNYDVLIRWQNGELAHLQHSVDITDSKALRSAATLDELTGAYNRRTGKDMLAASLRAAHKTHSPLSVALFDINMLKQVNDQYGHPEGDRLLTLITACMRDHLGPEDYLFRLGGDEFVAVFPDVGWAGAMQTLRAVLDALKKEREALGLPYELSFCFGVTEAAEDFSLTPSALLRQADEKMYEQKRRFHIFRNSQHLPEGAARKFSYNEHKLYDALVQSTDDYLYVANMRTGVFRYSPKMVADFGLPGEVIENAAAVWGSHIHPDDRRAFLEANQEITDNRTCEHAVEYRAYDRNGQWRWLRCRGHLMRDELGEAELFAGFISDLSRENKVDPTTGLFDRFELQLAAERLITAEIPFALMLIDVDDLRHINHLYGRAFGDDVLRHAAQRIAALCPAEYQLFRMEGDMFAMLLPSVGAAEVRSLFASIRQLYRHQQESGGVKYYCSVSAGCCLFPEDAASFGDLLRYADYALTDAKGRGRHSLSCFSEELLQNSLRSLQLTQLLRECIENGFQGFQMAYQPIIRAADGQVIGAEALSRWDAPGFGPISPEEFIPLLEKSGLITAFGRGVFREALAQCRRWLPLWPEFSLHINFSYLQFEEPDFLGFLSRTLEQAGIPPHHLVVELTESSLAGDGVDLSALFRQIRALGMGIAMDDFGTGYSSLGLLKSHPTDIVKIDRAFIQDIHTSTFDATFIRFVVALCHDVGIQVCMEGIETRPDYDAVRPMGLDTFQGFYFGRPVTPEEFESCYLVPKEPN